MANMSILFCVFYYKLSTNIRLYFPNFIYDNLRFYFDIILMIEIISLLLYFDMTQIFNNTLTHIKNILHNYFLCFYYIIANIEFSNFFHFLIAWNFLNLFKAFYESNIGWLWIRDLWIYFVTHLITIRKIFCVLLLFVQNLKTFIRIYLIKIIIMSKESQIAKFFQESPLINKKTKTLNKSKMKSTI